MPEPALVASRPSPRLRWALFASALVCGLALDLGTKEWAFRALTHQGDSHVVNGYFAFTRATNPGAAFGLFAGQHTFFMLVTVVAFVAVPYFVHVARRAVAATAVVLGLVLSGVVGNFWDRVVHGEVRDFLDVHAPDGSGLASLCDRLFGSHVWPTFNVADMWITGGAIAILVGQYFLGDPAQGGEEAPRGEGGADAASAQETAPAGEAEVAGAAAAGPERETEGRPATAAGSEAACAVEAGQGGEDEPEVSEGEDARAGSEVAGGGGEGER